MGRTSVLTAGRVHLKGHKGVFTKSKTPVPRGELTLSFSFLGFSGEAPAVENGSRREGKRRGHPLGIYAVDRPVRALTAWKPAAGSRKGALFGVVDRHGRVGTVRLHKVSVGVVVKRAAEAADLDPAKYAGHSLRARLETPGVFEWRQASWPSCGKPAHRSLAIVGRYIRDGSLFREHPASRLW